MCCEKKNDDKLTDFELNDVSMILQASFSKLTKLCLEKAAKTKHIIKKIKLCELAEKVVVLIVLTSMVLISLLHLFRNI